MFLTCICTKLVLCKYKLKTQTKKTKIKIKPFPGVYACVEPHQPIPNLVVKRVRGENTSGEALWKNNLMPGKNFCCFFLTKHMLFYCLWSDSNRHIFRTSVPKTDTSTIPSQRLFKKTGFFALIAKNKFFAGTCFLFCKNLLVKKTKQMV